MSVPNICKSSQSYSYRGVNKKRTPRRSVDFFISKNFDYAEKQFYILAEKKGTPEKWIWKNYVSRNKKITYRSFPTPWRGKVNLGYCQMCGCKIYKLGWHKPWGENTKMNKKASWHAVCGAVYERYVRPEKSKSKEIDHHTPLYRAYRVWGETENSWPTIAYFWSPNNIQHLSYTDHKKKSADEASERSSYTA